MTDQTYRRAKPYRVTLTFALDIPDVNMCESQRVKPAGSTYQWVEDFRHAKNAAAHVKAALAGAFDTLSEFVYAVDAVRWGKRAGSKIEGVSTFRKRVEGRERAPVDMGAVLLARACQDPEFQAAHHRAIRAEYETAMTEDASDVQEAA